MSARSLPTVEDLTRTFHAKLTEAARRQYPTERLVSDWLAYVKEEHMGDTLRNWRSQSARLVAWLAKNHLHVLSMTRQDAQAWVRTIAEGQYAGAPKGKKIKAGTVLNHAICGTSFFNYLADVRGLVLSNPFREVQKSIKRKNRAELRPDLRAIDADDVATILEAAETLDDFLFELLLFKTGIRLAEAMTIRTEGIDWSARTIHIEAHPKRTQPKAYFDEELEHFLKLKVERNKRDHPGNPWLWPSPTRKGAHLNVKTAGDRIPALVRKSSLAASVTSRETAITPHTNRRAFTSVLKRAGCPSHVVAALRGDSLLTRGELTPDPTQGIYTKFGSVGGKPELRHWYDKCMPVVGAREIWERVVPSRKTAASVEGLIRARRAGAA